MYRLYMTTTQNIKKELYELAESKGRKLYERYASWVDTENPPFDTLSDESRRHWILTALGKTRKVNVVEAKKVTEAPKVAVEAKPKRVVRAKVVEPTPTPPS